MRFECGLRWVLDGAEIDPRLLRLLAAIARTGSLNQAVREVGWSYRHAWGMLGRLENALRQPLATLARGRGTSLTAFGEKLIAADDQINAQLAPLVKKIGSGIERDLARSSGATDEQLVIQASHDMALARLRDWLVASGRCRMELHFQGSLDALAALARGQCDLAGFHVPERATHAALLDEYHPWLKARTLRMVHFVTRRQGLMVARGNPRHVRTLADLVKTKARFVNRQPGSGTRLFFDHLLATAKIRPTQINGYQYEEFTHAAVAATIASGMADAGFGIEAAARQHGLDFVPLATERYFLAARSATLARAGPRALLEALASAAFRKILCDLPGYTAPKAVAVLGVRDVFGQRS